MGAPDLGTSVKLVFAGSALTLVKSTCWKKVPPVAAGLETEALELTGNVFRSKFRHRAGRGNGPPAGHPTGNGRRLESRRGSRQPRLRRAPAGLSVPGLERRAEVRRRGRARWANESWFMGECSKFAPVEHPGLEFCGMLALSEGEAKRACCWSCARKIMR